MKRRPRDIFIPKMRPEVPLDKDRRRLIERYKRGGVEFESDFVLKMGYFKNKGVIHTDPVTGEKLRWIYVGESWWCRKRKKGKKRVIYEFARLMAFYASKDRIGEINGLWDARRHIVKQPPVTVYDGKRRKGIIVANNEYEVLVQWFDSDTGGRSVAKPVRDIDDLSFEYLEDHKKFTRIFANIKRNVN